MRLPNGARALVERQKILDYLMNLKHPEGSGKARFFLSLGFRPREWQVLAEALLRVARDGSVTQVVESVHGSKYIVDGELYAPNGQTALLRTVWITETGTERPRLITAYPREE
ncbi:MAG: DUF6883 domain-containing protein [Thermodesulfobacteriota bacterium]